MRGLVLNLILIGYLGTMLVPISRSLRFTRVAPDRLTVQRGREVWLFWTYDLDDGDIVNNSKCLFKNTTNGNVRVIAEGNKWKAVNGTPKVTIFSSSSLLVGPLKYQDSGSYMLQVYLNQTKNVIKTVNIASNVSTLIVEGKPILCGAIPSSKLQEWEKSSKSIDITVCASPKPALSITWTNSKPIEKTLLPAKGFYSRYTTTYTIGVLNRNWCGKNLTYFAKNKFGSSVKQTITLHVLFKPSIPDNLTVFYVKGRSGVEARWSRQESGLCDIEYKIDFLNSTGHPIITKYGRNIINASVVNAVPNSIRAVNVSASTPGGTSFKLYKLPPKYPPTGGERNASVNVSLIIAVGTIGIFLLITAVIVTVVNIIRRRKSN